MSSKEGGRERAELRGQAEERGKEDVSVNVTTNDILTKTDTQALCRGRHLGIMQYNIDRKFKNERGLVE